MAENVENELKEVSGGAYGPCYEYVVQPGDCLSMIAVRFHCTVQELQAINGIPNPDVIRAYQHILIPRKYL